MKAFMDKDFLLSTEAAKTLFHSYAAQMPIVDYHCHINPQEIYENRKFDNITQVWLGGDHYKWRMIRSNGVEEKDITGKESSDREKFQKYAEALPRAIGNPLYHWSHLELQRFFDVSTPLSGETAEEIWNTCNAKLQEDSMRVRSLIERSNVKFIGTTDDPIDSLEWHEKLAADSTVKFTVAPSFRPDKAVNAHKPGYADYIAALSKASGVGIKDSDSLCEALGKRIAYFDEHGCRASDHGLEYVFCREDKGGQADAAFKKAMAGEPLPIEELEALQTKLLLYVARQYAKYGWVMQIHYSTLRDNNSRRYQELGPDTGFDCIGSFNCGQGLTKFLDTLDSTGELPRTILYSLNPNDNAMLGTIIGCFQGPETAGKIQHGSAWWFNDTKTGMAEQLTSLANLSILGNFVGMLTDSRSFLSYPRHEYFRRILCSLIGGWIENGEYPAELAQAGALVQDICYNNAARYFGIK